MSPIVRLFRFMRFGSTATQASRVFRGAKLASRTASFGKIAKSAWRVFDVGLTGWFIYDAFFSRDKIKDPDIIWGLFQDSVLTPDVKMVLAISPNDADALCFGLTMAALRVSGDDKTGGSMTTIVYLSLANYISDNPSGLMYSTQELKSFLSEEHMSLFLKAGHTADQTAELADALEDLNLDEMELEQLRALDFLCYTTENYAELLASEDPDTLAHISQDLGSSTNEVQHPSISDNQMSNPSQVTGYRRTGAASYGTTD